MTIYGFLAVLLMMIALAMPTNASELSRKAATMGERSWLRLDTNYPDNNPREFFRASNGSTNETDYADSGVWSYHDPTRGFLFYGGGHLSIPVFMFYREENNTWERLPLPPWIVDAINRYDTALEAWRRDPENNPQPSAYWYAHHGYDKNTIDHATGTYYFLRDGRRTWAFNTRNRTWQLHEGVAGQCCGSPIAQGGAFFPGIGPVKIRANNRALYRLNSQTDQWQRFAPRVNGELVNISETLSNHTSAEYSYIHNVMAFGDGNRNDKLWVIDQEGNLIHETSPPVGIGADGSDSALLSTDPATGHFLAISTRARAVYEYNPFANDDGWSDPIPFPTELGTRTAMIQAPICTNGVGVIFTVDKTGIVWLYRHSLQPCTSPLEEDNRLRNPRNLRVIQGN